MRTILCDLDGVLIRTTGLHDKTFTQAAEEFGIALSGVEWPEAITSIDKLARLGVTDPSVIAAVKRRKNELYAAQLPAAAQFHSAIAARIAAAKAIHGFRFGICTNSTATGADAMVSLLGLAEVADLVLNQECVANPKPAPDIYLLGMRLLSADPTETTIYEDSEPGIIAARATGASAILTTYEEMYRRIESCEF